MVEPGALQPLIPVTREQGISMCATGGDEREEFPRGVVVQGVCYLYPWTGTIKVQFIFTINMFVRRNKKRGLARDGTKT